VGSLYKFECRGCGYMAEVSGEKDRGFVAFVETMICRDCNELVDGLVRCAVPSSDLGNDIDKCPTCGGDRPEYWDLEEKPCPRCGKSTKRSPRTLLWDLKGVLKLGAKLSFKNT